MLRIIITFVNIAQIIRIFDFSKISKEYTALTYFFTEPLKSVSTKKSCLNITFAATIFTKVKPHMHMMADLRG